MPRSASVRASTLVARRLASFTSISLLLEQLREVLVEALAAGFAVADAPFELVEFPLQDVLLHQRRGHHDLDHRDAALPLPLLRQPLTQHRHQVQPQLRLLEFLLVDVEQGDQALDRHRRVGRVDGGEHQVARVGGPQRGRDGVGVAHFADQDHVRVLPHHRPQGVVEALAVGPDLDLADQALGVVVLEFDRVFHGDDPLGPRAVDLADDGRQRRDLPLPVVPADDDDAAMSGRPAPRPRREAQVVELRDLGDDPPHDDREPPAAMEDVGAEAGAVGHDVRDVQRPLLLEHVPLLGRLDDQLDHLGHVFVGGGGAVEEPRLAVHPDHRDRPGLEVQVRAVHLHGRLGVVVERQPPLLDVNFGLGGMVGVGLGVFDDLPDFAALDGGHGWIPC